MSEESQLMQQAIEAAPHRLYGPVSEVVQDRLINYLRVADMAILAGEIRPGGTAERQIREGVALAKAVLAMPPLSPVSSQDTPPPPRPEPRVWQHGVHTDVDPEVRQVVGGRSGVLYTRVPGKRFMWFGQKSSGIGFEYGVGSLLADEGHVTEVLPSVSTDPDGRA